MHSWDSPTCWRRLEEFCEEGKDKRSTNEVDLGHANRIVEALARHGQECEEKVRSVLSQKVNNDSHHPMEWLEPLVVRLAGQAHLESTIPLLIAKLQEDADLLNEECAEALTRIGTPAVLHAVAEAFPRAEHHFRLYATGPLEHIHSDLAVETCSHLLGQEKEEDLRRELAHALLCHFAREGIEAARRLLVGREFDFESRGLRNYLLETCTLMGERFPEYDEWLAACQLMEAYLSLATFPDVPGALAAVATTPLGILSNGSPRMLDAAVRSSGLGNTFRHVLSVDAVKAYKPSPAVYELGTRAFGLPAGDILFVSSNAWDVAGAKAFGYRTCWCNRLATPMDRLGVSPDLEVSRLDEIPAKLG